MRSRRFFSTVLWLVCCLVPAGHKMLVTCMFVRRMEHACMHSSTALGCAHRLVNFGPKCELPVGCKRPSQKGAQRTASGLQDGHRWGCRVCAVLPGAPP